MIIGTRYRWLVQHIRSECWLAIDPTESTGRTWIDSPLQALQACDPDALAARLRDALPPSLLQHLRLVPIAFWSDPTTTWWAIDA